MYLLKTLLLVVFYSLRKLTPLWSKNDLYISAPLFFLKGTIGCHLTSDLYRQIYFCISCITGLTYRWKIFLGFSFRYFKN